MVSTNNQSDQALDANATGNNRYERMLAVRHVAKILGVHESTVRMWADAGIMESYRIGPRQDRRIPAEAVQRVLDMSKQWTRPGPQRRDVNPT